MGLNQEPTKLGRVEGWCKVCADLEEVRASAREDIAVGARELRGRLLRGGLHERHGGPEGGLVADWRAFYTSWDLGAE